MERPSKEGGPPTVIDISTSEKVVELSNQAASIPTDEKSDVLRQVQELIINKDPSLLDNFLDEIIAFQTDRSIEVRKFVIGFIEEACKRDNESLSRSIANLNMSSKDESVNVVKKAILTLTQSYKVASQWLVRSKVVSEMQEACWDMVTQMSGDVSTMLDSENDGIRTHAIKFTESLIITSSPRTPESDVPKRQEGDISSDKVPRDHAYIRYDASCEEGKTASEKSSKFMVHPAISSINSTTASGASATIARQRPMFMSEVVQAYETSHANLPPTLAKSQVSSVRKNSKLHSVAVSKHPCSSEFQVQISTSSSDSGMPQSEITRYTPAPREQRKRPRYDQSTEGKKVKMEPASMEDDEEKEEPAPMAAPKPAAVPAAQSAIDSTADFSRPSSTPENVANSVLISMVYSPDVMPASFQATYTPVESAGTDAQIKHSARSMATQMTAAGIGPGSEQCKAREDEAGKEDQAEDDSPNKDGSIKRKGSSAMMGQAISVVGGYTEKPPTAEVPAVKRLPEPILPSAQTKMAGAGGRKKVFRSADVVQPLSDSQIGILSSKAVKRILHSERAVTQSGMSHVRVKLLSRSATQFEGMMKEDVSEYISEDIRSRSDSAFSLLYQEYNSYSSQSPAGSSDSYDRCLYTSSSGLQEKPEQRDGLFTKSVSEAPIITESASEVIRRYCEDESRVYSGMTTSKESIIKRPSRQFQYLHVLSDSSSHEKEKVRSMASAFSKRMYEKDHLRDYIEKFASNYSQLSVHPNPPSSSFGADKDTEVAAPWTEETVRQCLFLYSSSLPSNHRSVHESASVYTEAIADIKRSVSRAIEQPIRGMGMNSPESSSSVENCPKGAETSVTRCLHISTDKVPPSPESVERVRDLYHKRVPDVRFSIPVINGSEKGEVIQASPKLIKLNPIVVKEVFNRSSGTQHGEGSSSVSPSTPGDSLIALHNIDSTKCDMKSIIKATNLCFGEKNVYTSEVSAVVMQQSMEQSPLPMSLMRTVIQSLTMYPRSGGFVMNISSRLIVKQVWKYPKVWEGFVKCCQRTKPQSYSVSSQSPAAQSAAVFERCPEMRTPSSQHVSSFTPHQQAHIPPSIMAVSEAHKKPEPKPEPQMEPQPAEKEMVQSEPAPAAPEPPVPEPTEPEAPPSKDEEEPMEQEAAEQATSDETSDSSSQEDQTKDAEESTPCAEPEPEPAEEPMEETQPDPLDPPQSVKDPEPSEAAPAAVSGSEEAE